MIGETAYENKPGGRKLGSIIGQRTTPNAAGVPIEQWEIRSGRGIKFYMPKADVHTGSQDLAPPGPEPEPEPAVSSVPTPPPPQAAEPIAPIAAKQPAAEQPGAERPADQPVEPPVVAPAVPVSAPPPSAPLASTVPPPVQHGGDRIEKRLARRRSVLPVVVVIIGVLLCVVSGVSYALGFARKLSADYEAIAGTIPALIGLLIILIGTNLVAEQSKRQALLRRKLEEEARRRPLERPR
jgi:hypothetical protein